MFRNGVGGTVGYSLDLLLLIRGHHELLTLPYLACSSFSPIRANSAILHRKRTRTWKMSGRVRRMLRIAFLICNYNTKKSLLAVKMASVANMALNHHSLTQSKKFTSFYSICIGVELKQRSTLGIPLSNY